MELLNVTFITKVGTKCGNGRYDWRTARYVPSIPYLHMLISQADEGKVPFVCTSHRIGYDYRSRVGQCTVLKWIPGGTLYLAECAEGYAIIADESMLAKRLGENEMPEPISIYLFETDYARMTYALRLGWWTGQRATR